MIDEKIGFGAIFVSIFFALTIIISNIVGFIWLNSLAIFIVSFIGSILLTKFIPKTKIDEKILLLSLLLIVLLAYPLLTITPFFPAGADAVSTTMLRVLDGRIPLDHAQYGNLNLSYQLGFSLIANVFSEVFGGIDYLWPWTIAIFCGILQLIFVYLFSTEFFKNKQAGIISAILFFGGKLVYENVFNGEYAWVMGTAFMFLFLYLFLKKNKLQYIIFPTIFVIHPAVGFNLLVFMGIYLIFFKIKLNEILKLLTSLILVLPLIVMSYFPLIYNILFSKNISNGVNTNIMRIVSNILPWIGTAISIAFILTIIFILIKKEKLDQKEKFLIILFIISLTIFIFFNIISFMLAGRVIELLFIGALLFTTSIINKIKLNNKKLFTIGIVFILISLFFFASSSRLSHYRDGSKINFDSREFSQAFLEFDQKQERVLFLLPDKSKVAEFSNKIPYDINTGHMILQREFSYYPGNALDEFKTKSSIWRQIYFEKTIDLIDSLKVKYIAINKDYFDKQLKYEIVFEKENFIIYQK
jgi:hypothetical protein